ncbi:uncharacterized protein METZ01_LOCUS466771, partial [marine metagenome]
YLKGVWGVIWQAITGLTEALGGCLFGKPYSGSEFSVGPMLQMQSVKHWTVAAYGG